MTRASNTHDTLLQWLAQCIEHARSELAELIEEQHSVGGERDLTWAQTCRATTHHRRERHGVVRRTERCLHDTATAGHGDVRGRVNDGGLQRLLRCERWHDAGHSTSKHRLACPRRAHHQHVVCSRGGDFECAPRRALTTHIGKIHVIVCRLDCVRQSRRGPCVGVTQALHDMRERPCPHDTLARYHRRRGVC